MGATVTLSGCVVSVLLRRSSVGYEEEIDTSGSELIIHRIIGEREIGQLLEWTPGEIPDSDHTNESDEDPNEVETVEQPQDSELESALPET